MATGDGLLARIRPTGETISCAAFAALCAAARSCGNGVIEITSRGSVSTPLDARYVLLDFSHAYWVDQGKLPEEWRTNVLQQQHWARLAPRAFLADAWRRGTLRVSYAMPFDELLNWVDSRILGREITS